jgi:hypothetical protein
MRDQTERTNGWTAWYYPHRMKLDLKHIFTVTMLMGALGGCGIESHVYKQRKNQGDGSSDPAVDTADTTGPTDTGETHCTDEGPVIEVGTGEDVFETLDDGDAIEVHHGSQDGHHILGSIRTRNTSSIATIHFEIVPDYNGEAVAVQDYRMQLLPDPMQGECAWIITGMYAYLGRIDPAGAEFLNRSATMSMVLVDNEGRTASDSVTVVPYLPAIGG